MAAVKPMLGDIELELVQRIEMDDDQLLVQHSVPALEGDFLQGLGRRAARLFLAGVMTGPNAGESLKTLRDKFRAAEPTSFVADIATGTKVGTVLIEELTVRELAGKPERFEYNLTLRELIPTPKPVVEEPPPAPPEPPPPPPPVDKGRLVVEVLVKDQPDFDNFEKVVVSIEGTKQEDGGTLKRTMTNREGNKWTDEDVPPGNYKVNAVEANPLSMTDEVIADITGGQATNKTVSLSSTATIARTFIVHFRFDSGFIEPCMRAVLQDVEKFAEANKDLKMLIVGHTDRTGSREYNQSLSERRARSVFAYLTFGNDSEASLREWNNLRKPKKPGAVTTINDSWGTREYQHILQDLGFYPGNIDGIHKGKTDEAVRAFRCKNGLPPGTNVDEQTWNKLIDEYLEQDFIGIDEKQFLPNGSGILKWLGCGEDAPLPLPKPTRDTAFRSYRRVEILFVNAKELPCKVPEPDTYKLPEDGPKEPEWALGPGDPDKRHCFGSRECDKVKPPEWCIKADDETTITVKGSIKNEDGTPFTSKEGKRFVVTTSDGEFILLKKDGTPDKEGEHPNTGEPKVSRTNEKGEFTIPDKRVGVYTLEVREEVIVRLDEQAVKDAKGNTVCKRLKSDKDELKVVVLKDPVLREIRLPVAVHLMRGLQFASREIRTCPAASAPDGRRRQETSFFKGDDKAIRDLFEEANTVWRQARIRFNVIDIVREVFTHPIINECDITDDEFKFILKGCGYPEAINVFFFGSLAGLAEAGAGVSPEESGPIGIGGCALGDRASGIIVDAKQRVQVLAHELGHFLTLKHVDETDPANSKRLMLRGTFTGLNIEIVDTKKEPEVSKARASKGARLDCLPLKLKVTGSQGANLTRVGGLLSHEFIVIANAARRVIVDAVISDELLAAGKVEMEGGSEGASDGQRIVIASPAGPPVEVKATYTPNSSGEPLVTSVFIRVVTFRLKVDGATLVPDTTDTFRTSPDPNGKVKVLADIVPLLEPTKPNCVPLTLVNWTNGAETDDPLRREVSKSKPSLTTITAEVAGLKRTVTIEIRAVVLTDNVAPFDNAIEQVEIKGIVNSQLNAASRRIAQSDLFQEQRDSFFRARADLSGETGNTVTAILISTDAGGKEIDRKNITLTRTAGSRFVSEPLLPIPLTIPSDDLKKLNFVDFKFIQTKAGGKINLQRTAAISDPAETFQVAASGRVVHLFVQTFTDANTTAKDLKATAKDIRRQIALADRIWAQAGLEIKERSIQDSVPDPGGLLDLSRNVANPALGLTVEEQRLLGTHASCTTNPGSCPAQSSNARDMNVYYIRDIQGSFVGISYGTNSVIAIEGPNVLDDVLAHEIGHLLLRNWACTAPPPGDREHKDPSCTLWPADNVMTRRNTQVATNVDRSQAQNIYQGSPGASNTHPAIVFQ